MLKEEMTIEEAISRIDEHKYIHQYKEPRAIYITEAFDILIEVAKKYQKIKRIIKAVDDRDIGYSTMMDALHKVVGDENKN